MADENVLMIDEDENEHENKYLLCKLGDEEYGINIACVQGIEELQRIVHIPDSPEYMKGVMNMRGKIIPVIDLRLKFNMPERNYDDRTCIILTTIQNRMIGFVVDTVSEVKDIPEKHIEPPPAFGNARGREQYVAGIGKVEDQVKILIDTDRLLKEHELDALESAAEAEAKRET